MSQQQHLEGRIGIVAGLVREAAHATTGVTTFIDGGLPIRG